MKPGSLQSEIQSHWYIIQSHNSKSDARLFTNYMPNSLPIVYKVFTSHTWLLEAPRLSARAIDHLFVPGGSFSHRPTLAASQTQADSGASLARKSGLPQCRLSAAEGINSFGQLRQAQPASQSANQHDCFQDCSPCSPRLLARSVDRPGLEARQTCSAPIGLQSLLGWCEALA